MTTHVKFASQLRGVMRALLPKVILVSATLPLSYCTSRSTSDLRSAAATRSATAKGALQLSADTNFFPAGAVSNLSSSGAFTQLYSDNGAFLVIMQADGNLAEYDSAHNYIFGSATSGSGSAVLQNDGNLVVYPDVSTGSSPWNTLAYGYCQGVAPYTLTLQNDGNLVIYDATSTEIWSNQRGDSSLDVPLVQPKAAVTSTGTLTTQMMSPNQLYTLTMQGDGNLVLAQQGHVLWNTATYNTQGAIPPYHATMQQDGNFVVYDSTGAWPLWQSHTNGQGVAPYQLVLNNYGNVYVKDSVGHRLWSAIGSEGTSNDLVGATWSPPLPSAIVSQSSQGPCLDTGGPGNGVQSLLWGCDTNNHNQAFLYTLDQQLQVATDVGRCLTYETGTYIVDTQPCTGVLNQRWVIGTSDWNFGVIHPLVSSGSCLDAFGGSTANGTSVGIWTCNGGPNQQWAKQPIGHGIFDPSLPLWPNDSYNDAGTQAAQRNAWASVVSDLAYHLGIGDSTYTILPGIYRTGGVTAHISDTDQFVLNAAGAEIIAENYDTAFYLNNNTNFVFNGPATFDMYPANISQGQVTNSDASSYVSFNIMPGSAQPQAPNSRIMLYDQNGQLLDQNIALYKCFENPDGSVLAGTVEGDNSTAVCGNGPGPGGVYTAYSFDYNTQGAQYGEFGLNGANVAPGNFILTNNYPAASMVSSNDDNSVTINDVIIYGGGLMSGSIGGSDVTLNNVQIPRRPGTSRLYRGSAGVFGEYTYGSYNIFESEEVCSTDTLTDPFSPVMFTKPDVQTNVQQNQIWVGGWLAPDDQSLINIYDPVTLQLLYTGVTFNTTRAENGEYLITFYTNVPPLPVNAIVNNATVQPTLVYTDSYFHDTLSDAMLTQGGKLIQWTNNYVHHGAVQVTGLATVYGPGGGGLPADIVINNNTINGGSSEYYPIRINLETADSSLINATPIESATVLNNLVMTWENNPPQIDPIVQSVNVSGNVVTNTLPNF